MFFLQKQCSTIRRRKKIRWRKSYKVEGNEVWEKGRQRPNSAGQIQEESELEPGPQETEQF